MKILKIELQNINSLKSDSPIVIDFESELFKDVGLYAITGSTGAGKTTILDAITIALYHSVPRFNKSHIHAGLEDVVSYGADEAMARVTFATNESHFEAQWGMRLTSKNGNLLTNPREEVRLKNLSTGKIIAEKKTDLKVEIERITQLNYKQFLRSVMLAQGEFAAFLSANAKDKGELLEQITGEEIYKKIGQEIRIRINTETKILDEIKSKINKEDIISEDISIELKAEQKLISEKIKTLNIELSQIERIISWHKKQTELSVTKSQLDSDIEELEKEKDLKQKIIDKLALHEKAEPYKDIVEEIIRLENDVKKKLKRFDELNIELSAINVKIEDAKKSTNESKEKSEISEKSFNSWIPKLEEVSKLDTEISNNRESNDKLTIKLQELLNSISEIQKEIEGNNKSLILKKNVLKEVNSYLHNNKNIPEIESKFTDWNNKLLLRKNNVERISKETDEINNKTQELQIINLEFEKNTKAQEVDRLELTWLESELNSLVINLKSKNIDKLLKKKEQLEKEENKWKELEVLSKNFIESKKNKAEFVKQRLEFEENETELKVSISSFVSKINEAEKSLQDIEKILNLENTIKSLDDERKKLEKGKACTLCGSTEHPLVEKYQKIEPSKTQEELQERRILLNKIKTKAKNTEVEIGKLSAKIESNLAQEETITNNISKIIYRYNELNFKCKIDDLETITNNISVINDELAIISENILQSQKLQKEKDQKEADVKLKTEKASNLKTTIATLQEKNKNLNSELLHKENSLNILVAETKDIETEIEKSFSIYDISLPLVENTSEFIRRLENNISSFNLKEKELAEIKSKISQIENNINHNEKLLSEKLNEEVHSKKEFEEFEDKLRMLISERKTILPIEISTKIKRGELQNAKDSLKYEFEKASKYLIELSSIKTSKETEKDNNVNDEIVLSDKIRIKSQTLEKEIKHSDFNSIIEIKNALLDFDTKKQYLEIRNKLKEKSIELKTLGEKLKTDNDKLNKEKKFEISYDEAQHKNEEIELSKNENLKRLGEIKEQFKKDNEIKQRNKGVFIEIEKQEKILRKWTDLMTLLGGSKDSFNIYVQRLTLKNLIQFANIHLYKLNKRYSLKMNETYKKNEELNFKLIDHYQTNEARYVDTSSGGEKFIISLALALGLSDLASNNVNIGSLFIDEGFGTLDNTTLETVISTLETLQAQGKMIGIISHVENLKERIPSQIQVMKKSNGVSTVKIV